MYHITFLFISGTIPLRLLDQDGHRRSWSLQRKISEDSSMSCSRQDSSTSTFHMSRSSFSSDSSSQPRQSRPLLSTEIMNNRETIRSGRENKPKLCRQSAVIDEKSEAYNRQAIARKKSKEKSVDELCPVCARKEGFKSKELEEKFACFYNRLVESSCGESSEFSSKEDQIVLSSDIQSVDEKHEEEENLSDGPASVRPRIEVNPMAENQTIDFSDVVNSETGIPSVSQAVNISECNLSIKDPGNEKCKSLININTNIKTEKTKKSSSDYALVKPSLGNLLSTFRSFPSHEMFDGKKVDANMKTSSSTALHTSKSENIVLECISDKTKTTEDSHCFAENAELSSDPVGKRFLLTSFLKGNEIKATSSPNIIAKKCESSPLIDNKEE